MKSMMIAVFTLFSSLSSFATPSVLTNPLAMTITQKLLMPQEDDFSKGEINLKPERKSVFLFEDKAALKYSYRLQDRKQAPLIFIVPGTGGLSNSMATLALAEKFYFLGYHTVTVDNAFSWPFAIAGSKNGLPGYVPQDAQDLYVSLMQINKKLIQDEHLQPSSYSLMGYSLGALQGLFMQRIDETTKTFSFKKVLLIDPPADFLYALNQIDQLYKEGNRLSPNRQLVIFNRAAEAVSQYFKAGLETVDLDILQGVFDKLQFTTQDLSFLIGGTFRDALRDVIFVSQQIHDLKILKTTVTREHRNQRYEEARKFSFNDYLNTFIYPRIQAERDKKYNLVTLNQEVSIYQFEEFIKSRKNIYLVHSEDDFLLKAGDIPWLKKTFGNRALIFPYGGHCGSLNFPEFNAHIVNLFK